MLSEQYGPANALWPPLCTGLITLKWWVGRGGSFSLSSQDSRDAKSAHLPSPPPSVHFVVLFSWTKGPRRVPASPIKINSEKYRYLKRGKRQNSLHTINDIEGRGVVLKSLHFLMEFLLEGKVGKRVPCWGKGRMTGVQRGWEKRGPCGCSLSYTAHP